MKLNSYPNCPNFSSGPTKKPPKWDLNKIDHLSLGRSHRAKKIKKRINDAIIKMKKLLNLPNDYLLGIVPGSDTGAFEMALWNLIGEKSVDILVWEAFGKYWSDDIITQLKVPKYRLFSADYGYLPDLSKINKSNDIIFTYNGTTSGVKIPNTDWIDTNRDGLVFADATSACFAMSIDWRKIDVATFSWQKCLGGEGSHGVLILSPRAVERLETFEPRRAIPKIFKLTKNKKLINEIFLGETINTPSMLCIEDLLISLDWAHKLGGLNKLIEKSQNNLNIVKEFVKKSEWLTFLCKDQKNLSSTSICLELTNENLNQKDKLFKIKLVNEVCEILEQKNIAYDIKSYRAAPPGFRIWGGPTVDEKDLKLFLPWLDWAISKVNYKHKKL